MFGVYALVIKHGDPGFFRIIHGNVSLVGGSRGLPICADWIKLWLGEHHQASMILVLQSSTIWQEEHDFRIFPDRISICSCRIFCDWGNCCTFEMCCAKSMIYILEHDLEVSKSWGYYQIIYFHRIFQSTMAFLSRFQGPSNFEPSIAARLPLRWRRCPVEKWETWTYEVNM